MISYLQFWQDCELTQDVIKRDQIGRVCSIAMPNMTRYQTVAAGTKIPWPIIAAIHFRESGQDFTRHLHNGDPLTARTVHVPAGRPVSGSPPFTWQDSAIDALTGFWRPQAWDMPGMLEFAERYNGLGYQKLGVNSPYLWDLTDKYVSGLFVADGHFDPDARESRPGVVSILKILESKGISLDFSKQPVA